MTIKEWTEIRLADVIKITHGYAFEGQHFQDEPSRDVLLTPGNFAVGGGFKGDKLKFYVGPVPDDYILAEGDVIVTMTDLSKASDTLGYPAIIPAHIHQRFLHNQRLGKVIVTAPDHIDSAFLFHLMCSKPYRDEVLASATGTTVRHTSPSRIRNFRCFVPPLPEQQAIASVLGALNDKIDLNHRMNETLEAMACALFQSWFVDFDPVRAKMEGRAPVGMDAETTALFPCAFEDSPLGDVPQGWRVVPLDETARFLNGLALQKFPPNGDEFLPVIKIAELRRGVTSASDKANPSIPADYIVSDGDFLFSWSGSLEAVLWTGGKGALNQHLFKVTSNIFPQWFVFHWVKEHLSVFRQIAASKATTMGHIQRHHLREVMVIVPPHDMLTSMTRIMAPLLDKMICNAVESRTLATIRDTLLPQLISGEVRVRDAEQIVEAVL